MNKTIIAVTAIAFWCFGCVGGTPQGAKDYSRAPSPTVGTNAPKALGASDLVFDPVATDTSAVPDLRDLPVPANLKKQETARSYTGIIKNKTKYEVSVPSGNSDANLIIPAHSWIEYTIWTRRADVTAYHDGKAFYCLKLWADPSGYPFMCKEYDFMAEIVKPEPAGKYKPMKKRKRV